MKVVSYEVNELKIKQKMASWKNETRQYRFEELLLSFFLYSFVGWLWEVVLHIYYDHALINRGVLLGPWLPVYGTGCVVILVVCQKDKCHPGKLFGKIVFLCGTVEYIAGAFLEHMYHQRWWDYSDSLWNIQGRVCLEGLVLFGVGGLLVIYVVEPFLVKQMEKYPLIRDGLCIFLTGIFLADVLFSLGHPNMGFGVTNPLH